MEAPSFIVMCIVIRRNNHSDLCPSTQDDSLQPKQEPAGQFKPVVPWPRVEGVEVDLNAIRLKNGKFYLSVSEITFFFFKKKQHILYNSHKNVLCLCVPQVCLINAILQPVDIDFGVGAGMVWQCIKDFYILYNSLLVIPYLFMQRNNMNNFAIQSLVFRSKTSTFLTLC